MVALNLPTCPHCGKIVAPVPEGHTLVCFGHGLTHFIAQKVEVNWSSGQVKYKQFVPPGSKPPKDTGTLRHSLPRWRKR